MSGSTSYFDQVAADWDKEPRRVAVMRAIGETILREAELTGDRDLLDYGCGTGLIGLFLHPHVRSVTGADNSPGMLLELQSKIAAGQLPNVRAIRLDLEQDGVPGDRYHVITVGMVLHHIADTEKILQAFHAMLVPGGMLCIADLDTEPGTFHSTSVNEVVHHFGFDRKALHQRLRGIGFEDTKDVTACTFMRPVEDQGEQEFSIFLITARRPAAQATA